MVNVVDSDLTMTLCSYLPHLLSTDPLQETALNTALMTLVNLTEAGCGGAGLLAG